MEIKEAIERRLDLLEQQAEELINRVNEIYNNILNDKFKQS